MTVCRPGCMERESSAGRSCWQPCKNSTVVAVESRTSRAATGELQPGEAARDDRGAGLLASDVAELLRVPDDADRGMPRWRSLPSASRERDRQRRSAGRGPTASGPAAWTTGAVVRSNGDFVSVHPRREPDTRGWAPGTSKPPPNHGRLLAHRSPQGGCLAHRHRPGFRQDSIARSVTSGGQGRSPRPFPRADCVVHHERNRMMARTKRSRRSYGAGERGWNQMRVFPELPPRDLYGKRRALPEGDGP